MNLKRKESEKWVSKKADEFVEANVDNEITFAEWCYQQGKSDAIEECIALFREWQPRLATNVAKFGDVLEQLKEQSNERNHIST